MVFLPIHLFSVCRGQGRIKLGWVEQITKYNICIIIISWVVSKSNHCKNEEENINEFFMFGRGTGSFVTSDNKELYFSVPKFCSSLSNMFSPLLLSYAGYVNVEYNWT